MTVTSATSTRRHSFAVVANRVVYQFSRHWVVIFSLFLGLYIGLPWLAPLFEKLGWINLGSTIYMIYSTQCHQLPQRSFFLFGSKPMYSLAYIQSAWQVTNNPAILRQFIGNSFMGWKVAWSDRMVSMFTSLFIFGLLYWSLRKKVKPLPIWSFVLLVLPMAIDGGTHLISDFSGIGLGFRDGNAWLAALTNHALPSNFYAGDSLGSFNSWTRLITGFLFGLGIVWLAYPSIERAFSDMAQKIENKFRKANLSL
jgi:uncharacterized membrane protein